MIFYDPSQTELLVALATCPLLLVPLRLLI